MAWAWHTEVGRHEAQGSTAFADAVGLLGGKFPFKATGGRRSQYEAQGRSWLKGRDSLSWVKKSPSVSLGHWFHGPADTKIYRCSSPLGHSVFCVTK